jgi:DNA-binding NtrC family response regulator
MPAYPQSAARLVLLVDEDLRTVRRLARMLREDGFQVEVACDGAAAIARFSRAPVPVALVTELTIAHVDGISVSHYARTRRPGLPVFIVTGHPHLIAPGAVGEPPTVVFTKPLEYAMLRDALLLALREPPQD